MPNWYSRLGFKLYQYAKYNPYKYKLAVAGSMSVLTDLLV